MDIRQLTQADYDIFDSFLQNHTDTSMFLRSNARQVGLEWTPDTRYSGEYWASFADDQITGVLAQYWNGNVMMQAPDKESLDALIIAFQNAASRPLQGVLGPDEQARHILSKLNISEDNFQVNHSEIFYSLALKDLKMPSAYDPEKYALVPAREMDPELLIDWIYAYDQEALGIAPGKKTLNRIRGQDNAANRWALLHNGTPVSLCGFNARLPEIVQIGPVWTPTEERGKHYARINLALALEQAKAAGVERSVLFTDTRAAAKAYESLGYEEKGKYCMALLKQPIMIRKEITP